MDMLGRMSEGPLLAGRPVYRRADSIIFSGQRNKIDKTQGRMRLTKIPMGLANTEVTQHHSNFSVAICEYRKPINKSQL